MEFGGDLVGVGVAEVVEDIHRALPGLAAGTGIAGGTVGVAEVGERDGFEIAVTESSVQLEGMLVAGDGLMVVAEVVVGVAEAIPCVGLTVAIAELLQQGEGLLAGREGLLVFAELCMTPADRVEGVGLPVPVAGSLG